jgi:GMP synthase-like glutamine amidotransferase
VRALVIQYDADAPGGLVSDWLQQHGAEQDVYRIDLDGRERDPHAYDLVVSLGSEAAAYDDSIPWMQRATALVRDAANADVPVLGICFGAQQLARALGGEAMRAERAEIGWVPVRTQDPALVAEGPWLAWHYDTFTLPPGATLLAESAAGPHAYAIRRSLGLQFHPEVTLDIMKDWVVAGHEKLARDGVDPDRFLAETRELDAGNRSRAWRLLDEFVERVVRGDGTA